MHSADYAVARCLSVRPSVCMSVYLTHAGIYYTCHILKLFSTPFWFFHTKRRGNIPTGTPPLTAASNAKGMKNHDFRPISRFISKIMQDRPIVTIICKANRKVDASFRMIAACHASDEYLRNSTRFM